MTDFLRPPFTGSGDATPKVATKHLGTGEDIQLMLLTDPTGANLVDALTDADALANDVGVITHAREYAYGGASWDRVRTPKIFKSFASTAITAGTGITLWTPTSGKKFRLLGCAISYSAAAQLIFGDNAVGTVILRSPTLAAAGIFILGAADLGNGILSAAANNVLKLDATGSANAAGAVWGVEE